MQGVDLIELLIAMMLSTVGGVVRRLTELEKNPSQQITFKQYIVSSIISCFVGIIMYALLGHFDVSMLMTIAAVSISGFIGSPVLKLLSMALLSKLKDKGGEKRD